MKVRTIHSKEHYKALRSNTNTKSISMVGGQYGADIRLITKGYKTYYYKWGF